MSFNFMSAITICSDFGAPQNTRYLISIVPFFLLNSESIDI